MVEIKERLRQALASALRKAREAGELGADNPPEPVIEEPKERTHGDLATNLAMALTRLEKKNPWQLAETILRHLDLTGTYVAGAEIAGPGFINFRLDPVWMGEAVRQILQAGDRYGRSDAGRGRRVLVEFVSANPTGPLLVVQARSAALGDALCNVVDWAGFRPQREFYCNDAGNQLRKLALTMEVRLRQLLGEQLELPEEAYPGEYVIDLAREVLEGRARPEVAEGKAVLEQPEELRRDRLGGYAVRRITEAQKVVLDRYGVHFDQWVSERGIREEGWPERVVALLRDRGHTYEAEGAVWFRSTEFGDDKDRVLIKSDGNYTYVVPDIAYHLNKFERGFDQVIDILGPDHHGYINRMRAALTALGKPAERFEVLISQWIRLVRGGEAVSSSKRSGNLFLLEDLLEEVGPDAARFFVLMRSADTHMDFDLDLAKLQSQDNPVFYVQYAHARIASILRQPEAEPLKGGDLAGADFSLFTDPSEQELIRHLATFPEVVAGAALAREPHRIARYATELAGLFHGFYTRCRVLTDDAALSRARLGLAEATRLTLQNALGLLGVSAPDRM
ncbi:MAG: arginine--tRNA ligase [Firmicutes bacterium]|nr:arginine--tRNA ligase [Bacillota bacterium]